MPDEQNVSIAVLNTKLDYLTNQLNDINRKLDSEYVSKDQFTPVKNIVYGMVGLILMAVIGALMYFLVGQHTIPVAK